MEQLFACERLHPGECNRYGVEMTVVTLEDVIGPQGEDSRIHQFATDLFNHWGLGDPEVGNGLLVMLVRNKRALEVVTGEKGRTKSECLVDSAHPIALPPPAPWLRTCSSHPFVVACSIGLNVIPGGM